LHDGDLIARVFDAILGFVCKVGTRCEENIECADVRRRGLAVSDVWQYEGEVGEDKPIFC